MCRSLNHDNYNERICKGDYHDNFHILRMIRLQMKTSITFYFCSINLNKNPTLFIISISQCNNQKNCSTTDVYFNLGTFEIFL